MGNEIAVAKVDGSVFTKKQLDVIGGFAQRITLINYEAVKKLAKQWEKVLKEARAALNDKGWLYLLDMVCMDRRTAGAQRVSGGSRYLLLRLQLF